MYIVKNNYHGRGQRTVYCTFCYSQLSITEADVRVEQERSLVTCPCCKRDFTVLTEAQLTAAHYAK